MRASRSSFFAGVLSGVLLLGTAAAKSDDIVDQIQLGLDLYRDGDFGAAITELEFALGDIRKLLSGQVAGTFPEPPEGWTAGEVESSGAAGILGGSGVALQRQYQQQGGSGRLEASLMMDNPMVQGMAAFMANPALIANQPNTERLRIGRDTGAVQWFPDQSRAEVNIMIDGRILLQVNGHGLESAELAVELLKAWDLSELRQLAAR